eukprot:scaffold9062_cov67-Skeletonema_dohrnii-CCMP3373.AAC.1
MQIDAMQEQRASKALCDDRCTTLTPGVSTVECHGRQMDHPRFMVQRCQEPEVTQRIFLRFANVVIDAAKKFSSLLTPTTGGKGRREKVCERSPAYPRLTAPKMAS